VCRCVSVCGHSHGHICWSIFNKIGLDVRTPKRKNKFVWGQYRTTASPILPSKSPFWAKRSWKAMQILSNPISALNVCKSRKFSRLLGNEGRGTRWWRQILDWKRKYGGLAHAQWKICSITLIYGWIVEIFASCRKSESRNTIMMSDFRPEVEIRPFGEWAMKDMQYNRYLWPNCQNFCILKEVGV